MQYDVSTPQLYLDALTDDWRKATLEQLRALIKTAAPDIQEDIAYKMLCYRDDQGTIFHLNAQKHYVSLYVGNIANIDQGDELLTGLDTGKGCIRFKKSISVEQTHINTFIRKVLNLHRQGSDIGC